MQAAIDHKVDVVEVTYCNSRSVAEHVVMMILSLVRDYHNQHSIVNEGGGTLPMRCRDPTMSKVCILELWQRVALVSMYCAKMKPFDVHMHYFDRHRLPENIEQELNLTHHESVESLVSICDVVTINCPLHPETEHLFNDELIGKMKRGAYIVNTARGKICDRDAIARALESGQLSGYAGDVWFHQPAPNDHIWRTMPNHGMTPHTSGTSLSAQARYAAGVREILECFFDGSPIRDPYLIVKDGELAGMGAHSYSRELRPVVPKKPQIIINKYSQKTGNPGFSSVG